jgi:integrase
MRDRNKVKLTDRYAKNATPGLHWDAKQDSPKGFLLRVTPAGSRAWCLNYRIKDTGRERRITLGDVGSWPVEEARKHAAEMRRLVDKGGDPLGELEEQRAAPTVTDLWQQFEAEELPRRSPRTAAEYKAMAEKRILPAIGKLKLASVHSQDIEKLHRKITAEGKARRADAVVTVASILFGWAMKRKMITVNPCKGAVERNSPPGRERYLFEDEIGRLSDQLRRWQDRRPDSCDALSLLILTGARRGEVLGMRWSDLDIDNAVWTKPAATVKQRKLHRVPLSVEAVDVLRRRFAKHDAPEQVVQLRRDGHVFKGGGDAAHVNRLERDWREIRAAAGLEDVRLHDLRHSFASVLVSQGLSLPIIGALLGHSKPSTTARYSHLSDQPLRQAAAIVGAVFTNAKVKK